MCQNLVYLWVCRRIKDGVQLRAIRFNPDDLAKCALYSLKIGYGHIRFGMSICLQNLHTSQHGAVQYAILPFALLF